MTYKNHWKCYYKYKLKINFFIYDMTMFGNSKLAAKEDEDQKVNRTFTLNLFIYQEQFLKNTVIYLFNSSTSLFSVDWEYFRQ